MKTNEVLGEEFINAPASTMESLNNAFTGGLIDHLLRVASYAVKFNTALPENEKRPNIFIKSLFSTNW
jgi:hypothetical protein